MTALRGRTSPERVREAVSVAVARGEDPHALGLPALAVTNVLLAMGRGAPVVHPAQAAAPSRVRGPGAPRPTPPRATPDAAERREVAALRAEVARRRREAGTLTGRLDAQALAEHVAHLTRARAGIDDAWDCW